MIDDKILWHRNWILRQNGRRFERFARRHDARAAAEKWRTHPHPLSLTHSDDALNTYSFLRKIHIQTKHTQVYTRAEPPITDG
jgi:hypothetical protein